MRVVIGLPLFSLIVTFHQDRYEWKKKHGSKENSRSRELSKSREQRKAKEELNKSKEELNKWRDDSRTLSVTMDDPETTSSLA